uniref:Uncharacterized protein n=1 Tax=Ditylenchus dipsaci TaxID=166011 RepID=A0A915E513_9BILA
MGKTSVEVHGSVVNRSEAGMHWWYVHARGTVTCNGQNACVKRFLIFDKELIGHAIVGRDGRFDIQAKRFTNEAYKTNLWIVHNCHSVPLGGDFSPKADCGACYLRFNHEAKYSCEANTCPQDKITDNNIPLDKYECRCYPPLSEH